MGILILNLSGIAWAQGGDAEGGTKSSNNADQEKKEWIRRWCKRAKNDPKCKFYAEKQLGQAMRDVSRADKAMGMDEYCQRNKDDLECIARREKMDLEEKRRTEKELMAFCRKNPDAPRCDPDYEAGADDSSENSAKKHPR